MKGIVTLTMCALLSAPAVFANGSSLSIREKARGTSAIDEEYVDELSTREAGPQRQTRTEKAREKMENNPRNPAMVESFESVSSEEEQKEEENVKKKQEAREGEAQGQDYDDPRVWR